MTTDIIHPLSAIVALTQSVVALAAQNRIVITGTSATVLGYGVTQQLTEAGWKPAGCEP